MRDDRYWLRNIAEVEEKVKSPCATFVAPAAWRYWQDPPRFVAR